MSAVPRSRYLVFALIVVVGCTLDLATKSLVFSWLGMPGQGVHWIWPEVLSLETTLNEGALFGIAQGHSPIFAALAVCAAGFVVYWLFFRGEARDWVLTVALAAVTGGILGNLYDRLGLPGLRWNYPPRRIGEPVYAVRDWIHFQWQPLIDWPLFNVADSLLVCGAGLLIWHALRPLPASGVQQSTQPST